MAKWIAVLLMVFGPVSVLAASEHAGHGKATPAMAAADMQMVEGQVRKVDKAAGKVSLAHGPLLNLNMPAMTMSFQVMNTGWLNQMKVGDRIRFMAEQVNGALTVVHFEAAK